MRLEKVQNAVRRRGIAVLLVVTAMLFGTDVAYADSAEQQVVNLVNVQRAQHGLPGLVESPALTDAAEAYADTLATGSFFSHVGPDGSTFVSRDEAAGYRGWIFLAENLAAGQTSPEQVVASWMSDPDHRANILSPNVREIGVGHVYRPGSAYGNYWVEEFGSRPGAPLATDQVRPRLLR